MSRATGATLVAVLAMALTSCSSDSTSDSSTDDVSSTQEATTQDEESTSALEDLTGDQMCALLTAETIEQALGVAVEGSESTERGRAPVMRTPYFLSRQCTYDTEGLPGLTTILATEWAEEESDDEVLDGVFTDLTEEPAVVGEYELIGDLGVTAGFGNDVLLSKAGVAGAKLGVVIQLEAERLLLTASTTGQATRDELLPLAEEVLGNLESALGEPTTQE